jgi:hypothetical protein
MLRDAFPGDSRPPEAGLTVWTCAAHEGEKSSSGLKILFLYPD